jgi:hypothetical protein
MFLWKIMPYHTRTEERVSPNHLLPNYGNLFERLKQYSVELYFSAWFIFLLPNVKSKKKKTLKASFCDNVIYFFRKKKQTCVEGL